MLVLEAGRPDYRWDVFIHMPAALAYPIGSRFYDWKYESEPEPHMNGRRIYHARGKVLGGSLEHQRDDLPARQPARLRAVGRRAGHGEWDYAHCLPYFKRMENCLAGADEFRGGDGPLVLERGPAHEPAVPGVLRGGAAGGLPAHRRRERLRQEGFAAFDRNIHDGRRLSAARAYLHPVMRRPNLDGASRAFVNRVLFDGTRAVGVEYAAASGPSGSRRGEVIFCGGAFNSPQLLQLSGVGNAAELEALGIDVVHDLPASASTCRTTSRSTSSTAPRSPSRWRPAMKWRNRPWVGLQWLLRSGPGATNHFEAGGFIRGNDDVAYPNLMFHFLPIAIRYDGSTPAGGHGYQVHVGPMYSDSRGSVKITSKDPRVNPALRFNYLSTEEDRREWVEAVRAARTILAQPAFAPFSGGRALAGPVGRDRRGDPRLGRP